MWIVVIAAYLNAPAYIHKVIHTHTFIHTESGLALKHGLTLVNSPGTIDSDYRGEVGVIVLNTGIAPFEITHGMRIAQMVIAAVTIMTPVEADDLDDTARAAGGFGSTGL